MSNKNLKDLLQELNDELDRLDQVDSETVKLLQELEDDVQRLVDSEPKPSEFESIANRAQSLEARFAAEHPTAERFFREIMDMLAKVGI
jgi:predicted patatin/cPLA2 family phospholipase